MTTDTDAPKSTKPKQGTKKKAFVVSPIGSPGTDTHRKAQYALKFIYKKALDPDQWEVHRADEGESPDSINQHVIKSLYEADLIIADLTGHNPNVFYELAIAHGIRKPVVHLISKGEKMPFDIIDQRAIFYDITDLESVEDTIEALGRYAKHAMDNAETLVTPLSSYERFNQIREATKEGGADAALASLLEEVVNRLTRLEHGLQTSNISPRMPTVADEVRKRFNEYLRIINEIEELENLDTIEPLTAEQKKYYAELQRQRNFIVHKHPQFQKSLLRDGEANIFI